MIDIDSLEPDERQKLMDDLYDAKVRPTHGDARIALVSALRDNLNDLRQICSAEINQNARLMALIGRGQQPIRTQPADDKTAEAPAPEK